MKQNLVTQSHIGSSPLTRRKFLTGVTCAGLYASAPGSALATFFQPAAEANRPQLNGAWKSSTCQGCTTWCPVQVKVVDGRVTKVRGNPFAKANHGVACPRVHMALQQVYDPDRIKTPMKRTNPKKGRGEQPNFVPITWDEAIGTIADRILDLRNNEETHKFLFLRGRYSYMRDLSYSAMPKIIGSPNGISHSAICAEAEKFAAYFTEGFWDYRDYDLDNTRYVLAWGADPLSSNRQVPHAISKWGAVMDQAKVAVIDPRLSATAAKADEWMPVIPGEDGALATAIAHEILAHGLWDKQFVGDFVDGNGSFVAGVDVDEATFTEVQTSGLVRWWNLELKNRSAEWAEPICGIPADQIRRVAIDFAKAAPYALSWVSPGASMQIRGGYGALAAHALNGLVGGADHPGGCVQKTKVPYGKIPDLAPFQDELAKKGSKYPKIDQRGTLAFPSLKKGKSGGGVVTNNTADAILNEDPYDIKVAIANWSNFAFSCSDTKRWEAAFSKIPFFVHVTTNPSETTHFADIVLPAAHQMFEKWSFLNSKQNLYGYSTLTAKLIDPVWDVRQDETEIPWMIAEKLAEKGFDNLLRYFKASFPDPETGAEPTTSEEFALSSLKTLTSAFWDSSDSNYGKYGDKLDGWSDFTEKGVWNTHRFQPGKIRGAFKTKTKKFEFYSETLKAALTSHAEKHETTVDDVLKVCGYTASGEHAFIPHYEPAKRNGDPSQYPLIFFEHRSRLNREGRSANCSWYQAHKNADPGDENWDDVLKMNPVDAASLNLSNGDMVKVTSPTGELTVRLKLWEGVRPGTVAKCFGQGHWAYGRVACSDFSTQTPKGGNNNDILPAEYDRLSGSTARHGGCTRVKVVRA